MQPTPTRRAARSAAAPRFPMRRGAKEMLNPRLIYLPSRLFRSAAAPAPPRNFSAARAARSRGKKGTVFEYEKNEPFRCLSCGLTFGCLPKGTAETTASATPGRGTGIRHCLSAVCVFRCRSGSDTAFLLRAASAFALCVPTGSAAAKRHRLCRCGTTGRSASGRRAKSTTPRRSDPPATS